MVKCSDGRPRPSGLQRFSAGMEEFLAFSSTRTGESARCYIGLDDPILATTMLSIKHS